MRAGDIYEIAMGGVWIVCGLCLFLVIKGYLPLRPNEEKRKVAEEWRKKYGVFAYICGLAGVILGVYHIISILIGKH